MQLICGGLRNSFDLAFNRRGDLFTFDSDMEWDLGAPWYRPTRICHLVRGGEFGWRDDAAIWPEYFEDSVAPVVNVGPSSPTGVVFGYNAKFPSKYQHALYACDWTFATIHAIHLEPHGATYRAKIEEFLGGKGLPVTDIVVGADGAMYFLVGGRRLGSALYRVRYVGSEATDRSPVPTMRDSVAKLHRIRRQLERFHGQADDRAIRTAWTYLGHEDRAIRFAARVAIESQPVDQWRQRAHQEAHTPTRIVGLLALARKETPANQSDVIATLDTIDTEQLSDEQTLTLLRAYELALARGEHHVQPLRESVAARLRALFPHRDARANRELVRLLCYLRDRSVITPMLERMAQDEGERPTLGSGYFMRNNKYGRAIRDILQSAPLVDRMHGAQMLLWIDDGWTHDQRTEYFRLLADAPANTKGGYWYVEFWDRIREVALGQVPDDKREEFAEIGAKHLPIFVEGDLPHPKGPRGEMATQSITGGRTERIRPARF